MFKMSSVLGGGGLPQAQRCWHRELCEFSLGCKLDPLSDQLMLSVFTAVFLVFTATRAPWQHKNLKIIFSNHTMPIFYS